MIDGKKGHLVLLIPNVSGRVKYYQVPVLQMLSLC
jgi:hypothetical protein